jgi:hypothetical protein
MQDGELSKLGRTVPAQDRFERARQCRHRAEQIRTTAEHVHRAEAKLTLVNLADSYEHMAGVLETLHLPE